MEQDEFQNKEEQNSDQINRSSQSTNRIMGIAAIFISVLSMLAVIYQSYLGREENELMRVQQSATVLPYLSHWYSDINGKYKFVVANKGVGPAFVKEVKFIAIDPKTKETSIFESNHNLMNFMEQKSELIDTIPWVKYNLEPNMLLSNNETIEVFSFSIDDDNQKKLIKKEFHKILKEFNIIYEDVYGSSWILDSKRGYPIKLNME